MNAIEKINDDYTKARARYMEANGWMAAHGGALVWGVAGVVVGFLVGLAF